MAATTLKPSIGLQNQFKNIRSGFQSASKDATSIKTVLFKKTKVKREVIVSDNRLFKKRQENIKRKDAEELLESKKVGGGAVMGVKNVIAESTKGFLGRIMDAIGGFVLGWLVYNLPNIIQMATDLIGRLKKAGTVLSNFVTGVTKIFTNSGRVIGAVLTNIVRLDFFDTSNRFQNSINDLYNSFSDLNSSIDDGIKLVTTPLGEMPGEQPSPMGTSYTTEPGGPSSSVSGYGTPQEQALLKTLRFAEGTTKSYGTIFGGNVVKELSEGKLTVQETINMADTGRLPQRLGGGKIPGYGSGSKATGAYQFMPFTLESLIESGDLNPNEPFTPEVQDRAALALAKRRGVTAQMLQSEGFSQRVSSLLAPEWASVPVASGKSFYGQPVKSLSSLQKTYKESLAAPTPSPAQTTSAPTSGSFQLNPNKRYSKGQSIQGGIGTVTSLFGRRIHPITGKYAQHGGIDIGMNSGTYISCKLPCKVVESRTEDGYGKYMDIIIPSLNIRLRLAHLSAQLITGGEVKPGQPFARSGNSGTMTTAPHLHLEATKNMAGTAYGGDTSPDPYVDVLMYTSKPPQGFVAPSVSQQPSLAQVSPVQGKPAQQVSAAPAKSPQVSIVNDIPQQQMQVPQAQSAPGQMMQPMTLDKQKVLNNLIKNHLLLDLSYT